MSELKKTIRPIELVAIGAAGVIGSSWLYLGSAFFHDFDAGGTILGMILATVLVACVAIAYSDLTTRLPRAGGEVVYAFVAGNRLLGFIVGWLLIGAYVIVVAFYVTATGRLLSAVWPALNSIPLYEIGGEIIYLPVLAIGVALALAVLALNWKGAEFGARAQLVLFTVMAVMGVVVVVAGFAHGKASNLLPLFNPDSNTAPIVSTLSFVLPAFAFLIGFGVVAIMAEEAKASPQQIGRIVVLSVLLAGGFYALVLTATAWVIPWEETANLTNGTIEAFDVAGMPTISTVAFGIGAIGIVTTFIAVFAACSRLMFAMARVEIFPRIFARVDQQTGSPRPALVLTTVLGLALGSLGPGALVWFLNTGGVYIGIVWTITVVAMYRIRRMTGHTSGGLLTTVLPAFGALAALAVVLSALVPTSPLALLWPYEYLMVIIWVGLGLVIYLLSPKSLNRDESLRSLLGEYYESIVTPETAKADPPAAGEQSPKATGLAP